MKLEPYKFSDEFAQKKSQIIARQRPIQVGAIEIANPLFLAPMSAICHAPYRLLMQELGAGASISELVSCHGILHGNDKTMKMLRVASKEHSCGLQLFGEDPLAMAEAAIIAQDFAPKFIDINMGCPVRKVVTKGAGSALLRDPSKLGHYFSTIAKDLKIPLSVKIRTGWDSENLNADEVTHIAKESGIFMVSIHGRTRAQKYTGKADWPYLEMVAKQSPLPVNGNGDLICANQIKDRLKNTACKGLMIGRGALRNPFIFLEACNDDPNIIFKAKDYMEIIYALNSYLDQSFDRERFRLIQLKKFIVWFAAGFPRAAKFRSTIFPSKDHAEVIKRCEDYFLGLENLENKRIEFSQDFLMSGHG